MIAEEVVDVNTTVQCSTVQLNFTRAHVKGLNKFMPYNESALWTMYSAFRSKCRQKNLYFFKIIHSDCFFPPAR